jgi:hypothetical protein
MKSRSQLLLVGTVSLALLALCFAQPNVINTKAGPVRGLVADSAYKFLGIPFAEPPTGNLRWADPVARRPWAPTVLDATSFAPGMFGGVVSSLVLISPTSLTMIKKSCTQDARSIARSLR